MEGSERAVKILWSIVKKQQDFGCFAGLRIHIFFTYS